MDASTGPKSRRLREGIEPLLFGATHMLGDGSSRGGTVTRFDRTENDAVFVGNHHEVLVVMRVAVIHA